MIKQIIIIKFKIIIWGIGFLLTSGCTKIETMQLATLTTSSITNVTQYKATCGGNITSDGGSTITDYGVCWSTNHNPTIYDYLTVDGNGISSYTSFLTGLTSSTTYYVRAFAKNSEGIAYGNELSFTTSQLLIIGDNYQGGKIAYIFHSNDPGYIVDETHGIIAAPSDQSTNIQWYNGTSIFIGAGSVNIGYGKANTNLIVLAQGNGNYAAKLCYDLTLGGYSDWFLPDREELRALYVNRFAIGGFDLTTNYWSSSENGINLAISWCLGEVTYSSWNKETKWSVRAIRYF